MQLPSNYRPCLRVFFFRRISTEFSDGPRFKTMSVCTVNLQVISVLSVILDPIFCKERLIECLPSTAVRRRYLKFNVNFAYFRTFTTETYCRKKESPSFLPSPPSHINQATVEGPPPSGDCCQKRNSEEKNRRHSF